MKPNLTVEQRKARMREALERMLMDPKRVKLFRRKDYTGYRIRRIFFKMVVWAYGP